MSLISIKLPTGAVVDSSNLEMITKFMPENLYKRMIDKIEPHEWTGKIRVSDLNNGPRETFLKYISEIEQIDLDGMIHTMAGSAVHEYAETDLYTEIELDHPLITGHCDALATENGVNVLIDYKHVGAYAVKKFLGIEKEWRPRLNQDGNPVVYKSGQKAGQPRMDPHFTTGVRDTLKYKIQLNAYRWLLQYNDYPETNTMKVCFIVRDGGTRSAKDLGIFQRVYYEPIDPVDDETIETIITTYHTIVAEAMETYARTGDVNKAMPELCGEYESWEFRKCDGYCSVVDLCLAKGDHPRAQT